MKQDNVIIQLTEEQMRVLNQNGSLSIIIKSVDCSSVDIAYCGDDEGNALETICDNQFQETGGSFFGFFKEQIVQKREMERHRTSETYTQAFRKFRSFRKGYDLSPVLIDTIMIDKFQAFLTCQGLCLNTISFYMRILRAVYNRAVALGMTRNRHPFKRAYTGIAKTSKRALALEDIRRIARVELNNHDERMARDQFMLSFYLRGMSFVDNAYLRKSDLKDGVLTYKRSKTRQLLSIAWEPEAQQIIDRWPTPAGSPYLLPIITRTGDPDSERRQYKAAQGRTNSALKAVARKAGVNPNLTMYCARHSWASIARDSNMPRAVISKSLGHASENTTQIYLNSIDSAVIDQYNHQIISLVKA